MTVLGVSYDRPESNRRFAEKNDLPFQLLSDPDHTLAKAVGASRALIPVPKRISYLVGAEGNILAAYPKVDPDTHAAQVIEDYRKITAGSTPG